MKQAGVTAMMSALLLLAAALPSVAEAAAGQGGGPASRAIDFRADDPQGQRIAKKLFAKALADDEDTALLRTAWVKVSNSKPPALFVMYGCGGTGNCGLYGYERGKTGWRLVLHSIAQTCTVLPSSHGGRHDLSASMHGSATESTIKTYWWRKNRYVRVSVRDVTHG